MFVCRGGNGATPTGMSTQLVPHPSASHSVPFRVTRSEERRERERERETPEGKHNLKNPHPMKYTVQK